MTFHDAFALHCADECGIGFLDLAVSSFGFKDQTLEIIRLELLSHLRQTTKEAIQSLLILVALTQVILEVRIDLAAVVDYVLIISEHLDGIFKDFV